MRRRTATTAGVVCFLAMTFVMSWMVGTPGALREKEIPPGNENELVYLGFEGVVLQSSGNDCGAAALMMVLEYHGIKISKRAIERKAGLTPRGVSILALKELAQSFGLHATGWRLKFGDLKSVRFPAILFVDNRHFIVLDSVGGGETLFVRDPAIGRMKIPRRVLMNRWKGETLVFANNTQSPE